MQVSLVATQFLKFLGHVTIATPQHAIAAHHDGSETDGATVCKFSKVFLVVIDDGKNFVATNPYLIVETVLRFNLNVTNRHEQLLRQFI